MSVFQEATRQRRLDSVNGQQRLPWLPAGAPASRTPVLGRLAAPAAQQAASAGPAPDVARGFTKMHDEQPGSA